MSISCEKIVGRDLTKELHSKTKRGMSFKGAMIPIIGTIAIGKHESSGWKPVYPPKCQVELLCCCQVHALAIHVSVRDSARGDRITHWCDT